MGKLLILSVTNGEEQILDRIKDFLAEEPGIEIVEPPRSTPSPFPAWSCTCASRR